MTEHSGNGWTANPNLAIRRLVVDGISFAPGIRDDDDVFTVLGYVATQYAARVEPLVAPGCWGWAYRANRNDPNALSNHASGTAIDINAPAHPNGTSPTHSFTPDQITACHAILAEVAPAIRWGGDYIHTLDPMHWEVNCDAAELHVVAERLRGADMPLNKDDLAAIQAMIPTAEEVAAALLAAKIDAAGDTVKKALRKSAGLPGNEAQ